MNKKNESEIKLKICLTAVQIYIDNPTGFSIKAVAEASGFKISDIKKYFSGKSAILNYFYTSIPDRYKKTAADIPGFDNFSLSDKLSNYIFTCFDLLDENRDFAEQTFVKYVSYSPGTHLWKDFTRNLFKEFAEKDSNIPGFNRIFLQPFVFDILAYEFMQLIRFWLIDSSDGAGKTLEYTDKATALFQEVVYSGVLDRGFDFAKYIISSGLIKSRLQQISESCKSASKKNTNE